LELSLKSSCEYSKLGNMRKGFSQEEASPRLDRLMFDKVSVFIYDVEIKIIKFCSH